MDNKQFNQNKIRNFCIIAHIDHGKSTLADRFLELTGAIESKKMRPCYLDMDDLEREKGITIKMRPVRMHYVLDGENYVLNLIDTPGHVDFSYEVSRALAAVEGAILLVDATKGIQAQTMSNLDLAKRQNLMIIPVVNKIDSLQARVEETKVELASLLDVSPDGIFAISARSGANVKELFEALIRKISPPKEDSRKTLRALIFDSKFDPHKGVIAFIRVVEGEIKKNDKIFLVSVKEEGEAKEVGFFVPELVASEGLKAGEIGYVATGIKEPGKVRVGDTITNELQIISGKWQLDPLPGYLEPKPMVFVSMYPENADAYDSLKDALSKLKLSDAALIFEPESNDVLGRGFRCGFLGILHAEIISERLRREFNLNLVISSPNILYKILTKRNEEIYIRSAVDFPDQSNIQDAKEPWVKLEVMTHSSYLGKVLEILEKLDGKYFETKYLSQDRLIIVYEVPLRGIVSNFYDQLKNATQGYGSMNYEILDYRKADLVKVDIIIAGEKADMLSRVVPQQKAYEEGKKIVEKLKEVLPPQQFTVALQAAIGGKVIARETKSAVRKDVTGYLYGGDYTRKKKLLEKQKKGKKELKKKGQLNLPSKVFLDMLRG